MWTGEAFAGMACHVPLQVRPVAKPGHDKHFSFSYFWGTIVPKIQFFVFQTHKMCIILTSDRILHRQTLVLRCALAPGADADVNKLSSSTIYISCSLRILAISKILDQTCFNSSLVLKEIPQTSQGTSSLYFSCTCSLWSFKLALLLLA